MSASVFEFSRRAFILFVLSVFASSASCAPTTDTSVTVNNLVIVSANGEHSFEVEIADTNQKRSTGLMYRTELPEDGGMLFDFGPREEPVSMWMKNTLIPLDMAFINKEGRIVRIAARTRPRSLASIASGEPVLAVLEVNGGRLEALGVEAGDIVQHPMFDQN